MNLFRDFVVALIVVYRNYISPIKGFSCAYRKYTGRASCSLVGMRAVRRFGAIKGLAVIRERTYICGLVHRRNSGVKSLPFTRQRGHCDIGCDGGDLLNDCDLVANWMSCCDCGGCDWPQRRRKRDEQWVYIPPAKQKKPWPEDNPR